MLQESGISSGDMDHLACRVERGTTREMFRQGDQMNERPSNDSTRNQILFNQENGDPKSPRAHAQNQPLAVSRAGLFKARLN